MIGQSQRRINQSLEKTQLDVVWPTIGSRSSSVTNSICKISQEVIDTHTLTMSICAPMSKLTALGLVEKFSVSHIAILHHLKEISKINKFDVWVPRKLTDFGRRRYMDACTTLLSKKRCFD